MGTSTHSQDTKTKRGYVGPYLAMIACLLDNKGDEANDGGIVFRPKTSKKSIAAIWSLNFLYYSYVGIIGFLREYVSYVRPIVVGRWGEQEIRLKSRSSATIFRSCFAHRAAKVGQFVCDNCKESHYTNWRPCRKHRQEQAYLIAWTTGRNEGVVGYVN